MLQKMDQTLYMSVFENVLWQLSISLSFQYGYQSQHHDDEKRALSREIIVLNNHLMEAKLTIEKLQEDNVRIHFCVAADDKMKHVESSVRVSSVVNEYQAYNTKCVIVAVGLIVFSGSLVFNGNDICGAVMPVISCC